MKKVRQEIPQGQKEILIEDIEANAYDFLVDGTMY